MIYMYKSLQYCDVRSSASLWCGIPTINTFLLTEPKSENVNNIFRFTVYIDELICVHLSMKTCFADAFVSLKT